MTLLALSRTSFALALAAAMALPAAPVQAQQQADTIFSKVTPSFRERAFMRINYVNAKVKTTSGDAYDVTGPVVGKSDIRNFLGTGSSYTSGYRGRTRQSDYDAVAGNLERATTQDADAGCEAVRNGLGTPCGIRARGSNTVGTMALSLGYYLDDEMSWVVEAYVLAAPLKVAAYGDGVASRSLNGQNVINLKMLPPTAVLGKYFGSDKDSFRPFVGLGASYAFFYDAKATDSFNTFVGGSNPGDTTVKVKNALGVGPFVGFQAKMDETWHLGLNVGKLRYKTDATLTTRNTMISKDSAVLTAFGPSVQGAVDGADIIGSNIRNVPQNAIQGVSIVMCDLANAKAGLTTGNTNCSNNFGTFVRKAPVVFDNTLFMLSLGRSF